MLTFFILINFNYLYGSWNYSLRKYPHVKKFYKEITPMVISISKTYNLPAPAVLALAGLESGYGRGYVGEITGNILSLGAFKGDVELPPLYLPYSKSKKKILFDPKEIKTAPKSDLSYKLRAKSYKKDYRPKPYAGTIKKLELLRYNDKLRSKAYQECFKDFATKWISLNSNNKVFRDARVWLNSKIAKDKTILFSMNLNKGFIDQVGGKKNSFNYRKTWPKKVKYILKKAGLVQLVKDIKLNKLTFEQAWSKK